MIRRSCSIISTLELHNSCFSHFLQRNTFLNSVNRIDIRFFKTTTSTCVNTYQKVDKHNIPLLNLDCFFEEFITYNSSFSSSSLPSSSSSSHPPSTSFSSLDTHSIQQNVKLDVAKEMHVVLRDIGFMYVKIPPTVKEKRNIKGNSPLYVEQINSMFNISNIYFRQEKEIKEDSNWKDNESNVGYVGIGREMLDPENTNFGDLKEAFNVGNPYQMDSFWHTFLSNNSPIGVLSGKNISRYMFKKELSEYFNSGSITAMIIMRCIALGLGLPDMFFDSKFKERAHTFRLLHYPALDDDTISSAAIKGQTRAGEHSDYGAITLLVQDEGGGLEVLGVDGQWKQVPYIPGYIIVNTGDLMQRWTNDTLVSTKHRVLVSPKASKKERYSLAMFIHPDDFTDIAPLSVCVSKDRPTRYPSISARQYLLDKLAASYGTPS